MIKVKKDRAILDRDLSWMYFNRRIMQEAERNNVPLLERLIFLGIYSNNLDEFFRVRVSTLYRILEAKYLATEKDVAAAARALKRITKLNTQYSAEFDATLDRLKVELSGENIYFVSEKELTTAQSEYIRDAFQNDMSSSTYPLIITQGAKLNELTDSGVYLAVGLTRKKAAGGKTVRDYALIELPVRKFGRFIILPSPEGQTHIILLDDAIRHCLPFIFAGLQYETFEAYTLKFTRDAELELDLDTGIQDGPLEKVARGVRNRKKGEPVRFVYDRDMPRDMLNYIKAKLNIDLPGGGVAGGRYHNMKDLMSFPLCDRPDLRFPKFTPVPVACFDTYESVLAVIRRQDCYLHYPYHPFSHYIRVLREAALSRDVKSIKTTIYRLASDSQVVKALICAARHGKKVTAVIELMARFDEESNINWAKMMQDAGVNVIFGVEGLKVHCKLTHIGSSKGDIACVSTGNFHEGNAKSYTDMTIMTAHKGIVKEVESVFGYIKQPYKPVRFRHLIVSPLQMRKRLTAMIKREMENARAGREAYILCKINHITDEKMVQQLYEASQAGVRMRFLVRGNCSVVAGVRGVSDNIEIRGIIDRFLEHSRVFIFCNGGNEQYYLGSADWMSRNLDYRIEAYVPVYDPVIREDIKRVIEYGLRDNISARDVDGSEDNFIHENGFASFRSQQEIYKYYLARSQASDFDPAYTSALSPGPASASNPSSGPDLDSASVPAFVEDEDISL